jgi:two-component system CheB/CheR fusion protein
MVEKKSSAKKKRKVAPNAKPKRSRKSDTGGNGFPLVCLGASAGGLKALEAFFSSLPEQSGMAFVIISHTDPDHTSLLPDILKRKSRIPIKEILENSVPEQNTVFLPPSNRDLVMERGRFRLKEWARKSGLHMPIDSFLESLAYEYGERSACIILSGTGTDGTHGLRLIKEAGGVSFAEAQSSAGHFGMPQSAIDTGMIDYVMEPNRMPEQLIDYFKHPVTLLQDSEAETPKEKKLATSLKNILMFLASRTNHDFSCYKKSTLIRRVERRIAVTQSGSANQYYRYLHGKNDECDLLFQDLLIGVTEFFREPEAFSVLEERVLPRIFARLGKSDTLRIWVTGCSSGEEVYSVAMVVMEYMEKQKIKRDLQIFGTDIDGHAIETAREGVYLQNIAAKVSEDRLDRFFVKVKDRFYRVRKEIREPVVFAVQDVLRDPPFTKLDLLFCRNLLIYLEADAQNRLIPIFHYSLKPGGALFLGSSETIGRFGEFFSALDKKHIYFKRDAPISIQPEIRFPSGARIKREIPEFGLRAAGGMQKAGQTIVQAVEQVLLQKHTPACVIVDASGHLLHVHGHTGKYLELPSGKPDLDVTSLAREGLRFALTSALRKAVSGNKEIRHQGLRVKANGQFQETDLEVFPLSDPPALRDTFMIKFTESGSRKEVPKDRKSKGATDEDGARMGELEHELLRVREDYRSVIEELETSNEELKSVNEEMNSANEELQSANEELESSREELQSLNEELNTVNAQLQSKNEELADLYSSITEVLNSTRIAILFLNSDLTVKRFTPEAANLLNLVEYDAGRPIGHISHNLKIGDLSKTAKRVLDTLTPFESDVQTVDGHWYRMCLLVYRSKTNVIEGVVATFINIDSQKKAQWEVERLKEEEIKAAKKFSESIVDGVREALLVLDENFRILRANRSYYKIFRTDEISTLGENLFALGNGLWNIPRLKSLLRKVVKGGEAFEEYPVEWNLPEIGERRLLLNARRFEIEEDKETRLLLAADDVSSRQPIRRRNA